MKEYLCYANFTLHREQILLRIYNKELQERRFKIIPVEDLSNHFKHIQERRGFEEGIRRKEGFSTVLKVKAEKW